MKGYLIPAFVVFGCLVGVSLAGSAPDSSEPVGCHGAKAAASCHAEAPAANCHAEAASSCHGRTTFAERRADRRSARADARAARADARADRVSSRGCHGQQAAPAPACECAEDCACRN
jgi:hypothetical protein